MKKRICRYTLNPNTDTTFVDMLVPEDGYVTRVTFHAGITFAGLAQYAVAYLALGQGAADKAFQGFEPGVARFSWDSVVIANFIIGDNGTGPAFASSFLGSANFEEHPFARVKRGQVLRMYARSSGSCTGYIEGSVELTSPRG